MLLWFWDASALIKRYFAETGSDTVDSIFRHAAPSQMISTPWGYTETFSLLVRRHNEGVLTSAAFTAAVSALQSETIHSAAFQFLPVSDISIFASVSLIGLHSLNATDAAILHALLECQQMGIPLPQVSLPFLANGHEYMSRKDATHAHTRVSEDAGGV